MFLIFVLFLNPALALTPEQVLKTAWSDKTYLVHDDIQDTDSKNPFRSVDAFYSVENNDNKDSEIGIKFNLKAFPEWKYGRSRAEANLTLKQSALAWALRDRYVALVGYSLGEQKINIIDQFIETSEKNFLAQRLALKAAKSSLKSFLDAKDELIRLKRSKALLLEEREILKKRIERWSEESEGKDLESIDLLDADDIAKSLGEGTSPGQTLTGRLAKEEILQLDQEVQILKGRERQWVKSFEVSQASKKNDHIVQAEITFQLPPLGSDDWAKQRQNELILKKAIKQRDLENMSDRLQILRFQILNSIEIYKLSKNNQVAVSKSKSLDPLASLQTKITSQKEQLELLNQRQSILTLYLDYLVESEVLSKEPGINHLSRSKKAISL